MIVAVEAHFPSLSQQQAAVVTELLGVWLADWYTPSVIFIVFDHNAGKTDGVFLCQFYEIRPPDFGIEVRNAHAVVPANISTVAAGHRGGKVIQIEHSAINHRVGGGIAQKAIGSRINAPHHLVIDADVVHYHPAGTRFCAPYQWNTLIPCAGIDSGFLPEADAEGGFEWIAELIPLPTAKHKLFRRDNAFGEFVLPRRG